MNRLKILREQRGMTQSELGQLLNVKDAAISKYESGKVPLTGETLIKLAEIFGVSTDYLLGISESPNNMTSISIKSSAISELENILSDCLQVTSKLTDELETLISNKTTLPKEVLTRLDAAYTSISSDIITIAKELNIPTQCLLCPLSGRETNGFSSFKQLNDDNQDIIIGKTKELLKEQRHESVAADEPLGKTGTMGK